MVIGENCLIRNTDLAERIRKIIPIINIELGLKSGSPSFRQVYNELVDQTGAEIDLDTFAQYYKSEIPADLKFTDDAKIDEIVDSRTKQIMDNLANGNMDALDGIGQTSPTRAVLHKVAGILNTLKGDASKKTKTVMKTMQDAVLQGIQRMANQNEQYKEFKQKNKSETFEQTLERVLDTMFLKVPTTEPDKFNTLETLFNESRDVVMQRMDELKDEDGENILPEEALKFLDNYKNAVFGLMMSTSDANALLRGSLIEIGFGKKQGDNTVVDWTKLAGEVNSPNVVHENVVKALEGKGLSNEAAESVASALSNEFANAVQGQKAMNIKYSLAEGQAEDIMKKLGWQPTDKLNEKVKTDLRSAIDESVENDEALNVSDIVRQTMLDNGATQQQLENLPSRDIVIQPDVAARISKVLNAEGELDAEGLQKLYSVLGKVVDDQVINDLKKLSKLRDEINATEIRFDSADGSSKNLNATKSGIEKAKLLRTISDQMARIVSKGTDYSDKTTFQKMLIHGLNGLAKYISTNASLVLLNPFNLSQNLLSGLSVGAQSKVGDKASELFGSTKTPIIYTDENGDKHDLSKLLNTVGAIDTWWNTTKGESGRDIPDLFSQDLHDTAQTFQSAETKGEKLEAALTVLPRAALSATDAMLKEPYFRRELIKGVLYYLQKTQGMSKKEAQKQVYEALTDMSPEELTKKAKEMASLVGKGNDKYYVGQVAEDIQLSSLMMLDEDGKSILNERNLQAIIDAAKQTSSEVFGHKRQKNELGLGGLYDMFSGGKALAAEGMNKDYGLKMADLYQRGKYNEAAWNRFTHNLKTTMGFLFQRGIFNWAVLMAQKNPVSIINGFRQLSKQSNFHDQQSTQESVENFLRSRAKIGRGVLGTASATAIVPLVMAALGGSDDDERRKKLAALKKDPVLGRLYNNFVPPAAQAYIDASLSKNIPAGAGNIFKDMTIQPIVSAGSKYYSIDNILSTANDYFQKGEIDKGNVLIGGLLGSFLPGKSFVKTNAPLFERLLSNDAPDVIKNGKLVPDRRAKDKPDDFMNAFWYSSILNHK